MWEQNTNRIRGRQIAEFIEKTSAATSLKQNNTLKQNNILNTIRSIKIGTRKSQLALIQTRQFTDILRKLFPEMKIEIVEIVTSGDKILNKNLYDIGGKALFLKELEEQLLSDAIDIAVHSLKDVPGLLPRGLKIAAVLPRENPFDAFVSHKYSSLAELPSGAKIGSSSVRRGVFLQKLRPDCQIVMFRGNVGRRLEKLRDGEVDATILAAAGLLRLELWDDNYCNLLSAEQMLPAAGQGIIALEICSENQTMQTLLDVVNDKKTWNLALAERGLLSFLDASCRTPISAHATYDDSQTIRAQYMLADFTGKHIAYHTEIANIREAEFMGIRAAKCLQDQILPGVYK